VELAHLRGARDLLDREYARPLGVPTMARAALMSPRTSRGASARPLARRRTATCRPASVERAMALLRRGDVRDADVLRARLVEVELDARGGVH